MDNRYTFSLKGVTFAREIVPFPITKLLAYTDRNIPAADISNFVVTSLLETNTFLPQTTSLISVYSPRSKVLVQVDGDDSCRLELFGEMLRPGCDLYFTFKLNTRKPDYKKRIHKRLLPGLNTFWSIGDAQYITIGVPFNKTRLNGSAYLKLGMAHLLLTTGIIAKNRLRHLRVTVKRDLAAMSNVQMLPLRQALKNPMSLWTGVSSIWLETPFMIESDSIDDLASIFFALSGASALRDPRYRHYYNMVSIFSASQDVMVDALLTSKGYEGDEAIACYPFIALYANRFNSVSNVADILSFYNSVVFTGSDKEKTKWAQRFATVDVRGLMYAKGG